MTKIYILSDGRGPARYVGKTTQPLSNRLSSHRSTAKSGDDYRSRWIRSASVLHIDLVAEVVGDGCAEEIGLIASLKSVGARLTNHTAGGEGALGRVVSMSTREQIRSKLTGRKGPRKSEETRQKLRAALKGRRPTQHVLDAGRAANTGRKNGPLTDAQKAKISATKIRITEEKLSQARKWVADGWSQQRAADALGVSQSQLSLRLKGQCR